MTPEQTRTLMRRFHSMDTRPEMWVRSAFHRRGLRFRLHGKGPPARPDIVLALHRTVIFVHSRFWHRHDGCKVATTPKSKPEVGRQSSKETSRGTPGSSGSWRTRGGVSS